MFCPLLDVDLSLIFYRFFVKMLVDPIRWSGGDTCTGLVVHFAFLSQSYDKIVCTDQTVNNRGFRNTV